VHWFEFMATGSLDLADRLLRTVGHHAKTIRAHFLLLIDTLSGVAADHNLCTIVGDRRQHFRGQRRLTHCLSPSSIVAD
jgi:hypothetical protein